MDFRYTFTVFTPTYNRAYALRRVFESLEAQTFTDFEWLIVDDGSVDSTAAMVEAFRLRASFPIRYFFQENCGKHVAMNRAVKEAAGRFFATLDSDDACVPEALERLLFHWNAIPEDQRKRFSAVTALCMNPDGRVVGEAFPVTPLDVSPVELRYKLKVRGDKWGFQTTEVMRQFPFPVPQGEKFVTEALVWNAIGKTYLTRFVNECLYICVEPAVGEAGRLTNTQFTQQVQGRMLFEQSLLNDFANYARYSPISFCKSAANYARCGFHLKRGLRAQWTGLTNWTAHLLWLLTWPVGLAVFWRDHVIPNLVRIRE